jgi:apolipoprotein N-acyltransferase
VTGIDSRISGLAVLFAGALAVTAFAPYGWYPVAILSLAVLFNQWLKDSPRQALLHGGLFGLGFFGAGVSWVFVSVYVYGHVHMAAAILVTLVFVVFLSLYPALLGYFLRRMTVATTGLLPVLVFAAGWIVAEWLRGWLFTGFPWLSIGSSQVDSLLSAYAPVAGVYGVGLAVTLSAGLLVAVVRNQHRLSGLFLLVVIWAGAWFIDEMEWTTPADERLQVALVQGNIAQEEKWLPENIQNTLTRYTELTFSLQDTDLVVWPETAIPAFYHQVKDSFIPDLELKLQESGMSMLTGIPVLDKRDWEYFNAVTSIGDERMFYHKRHLVPFGEYLPLRERLKRLGAVLNALAVPGGDFTRGDDEQTLIQVAGYPVGASICFEVAFSEEIALALPQAALLVNVSNDAWFGNSLAPHQHLEMARLRAMETGRPMLRATNTGISAIIDYDGAILASSAQFEAAVVTGSIAPRQGATPYVRLGNAPVIILCSIFLLLAWLVRRPRS